MMTDYLPRTLLVNGEKQSERFLLSTQGLTVILAEPGAGKTFLMRNLAKSLDTTLHNGQKFLLSEKKPEAPKQLLIDALDEIVTADDQAVNRLLVRASDMDPQQTVLAIRAANWNGAYESVAKNCFEEVQHVYLVQLDDDERRRFFVGIQPEVSFTDFAQSMEAVGLYDLTGNPLMLQLFAAVYASEDGAIDSKLDAFNAFTQILAKEHNRAIPQPPKAVSYTHLTLPTTPYV